VSEVVLQREVDGVYTAIHFTNKGIVAPLAFTGTYNTGLLGCVRFRGWANALVNLEYDRQSQILLARVAVQDFHLSDLSTRASGVVKELVQSAINKRVNQLKFCRPRNSPRAFPSQPQAAHCVCASRICALKFFRTNYACISFMNLRVETKTIRAAYCSCLLAGIYCASVH
jgi:hypothetical protein